MFQKSTALSIHFEMRRSLFAIEFTTFVAKKNHNLFVKFVSKRELEKKEFVATGL
jgi:hypothetical protein